MAVFDYNSLYTAYAGWWYNLFLKDVISIRRMVNIFYSFSYFSRSKQNSPKVEILESWKRFKCQSVCGMHWIDLNKVTLWKILGTRFSCNKKLKEKKNYKAVTDIRQALKIWKIRNLALEGEIVIFKTTAISKIVFQSFITTVPKHIVNELENIQKPFFTNNSTPKIKH